MMLMQMLQNASMPSVNCSDPSCYGQVLWCQVQAQVQGQESWFGLDMFRFLSRLIVSFRDKLAKLGRFVSFGLL